MASVPSNGAPVCGRVDRIGRLLAADPLLLRLQEDAGAALGDLLALPQLAMVARSAMKLGVPLSRGVLVASSDQDLDLWVRAEPDEEGATLRIDGWTARPAAPPRLSLVVPEVEVDTETTGSLDLLVDSSLTVTRLGDHAARRLGLTAAEVVGQPLTRHFHLSDGEDGTMPLLTALARREDFASQPASIRGGDRQPLLLAGRVVRNDSGEFEGFALEVALPDQAAADVLASLDPALDEALRSPLDRIIAAADRIVERTEGPLRSDYAAYAGDIAAAGRHLLSVIRTMTQTQGSAETDAVERIDLVELVEEALQLVQGQAEERNIRFERVIGDSSLPALGDRRSVVQILVNLLGNAVRHSPDQGTIAIIAERSGERVAVTIADEGPGIAEADHQRIFERYEQVGEPAGGIGLGLAIARRLARSMGGEITLHSRPGEGARFSLLLSAG